jgi:Tfp pilus assembly protein PilX
MKRKNSRQRGVALLLTLGVLSVLLALAMAFITNTIIARKIAAANSSRSQARFFAKSAVGRAMVNIMTIQVADPAETDFTKAHSQSFTPGPTDGLVSTVVAGTQERTLLDVVINNVRYSPSSSKQPQWMMVRTDNTTTGEIIGRYAFMILPPPGQINFSEVLRGDPGRSTPLAVNWYNRRGIDMKEFNLRDRTSADAGYAANLTSAANALPDGGSGDYVEFDDIFTPIPFAAADETWIRNNFAPSGYSEAEAFTFDISPNTATGGFSDTAKHFHRFNLARTDWNTGFTLGANSTAAVDILLGAGSHPIKEFKSDDAVTPADSGIQFLRMIGDDAGAYPSLEARRRQIAANLLDYADADSIPSSDSTDWWNSPPTYTGNEKTPYINEIGVGISLAAEREIIPADPGPPAVPSKAKISGTVELNRVFLELVNIYDQALFADAIRVSGSIEFDMCIGSAKTVFQSYTVPFEGTQALGTNVNANSYKTWNFALATSSLSFYHEVLGSPGFSAGDLELSVVVNKIMFDKVYLTGTGGQRADFVRDLTSTSISPNSMTLSMLPGPSSQDSNLVVACSVDDPRENLFQGPAAGTNWEIYSGEVNTGDYPNNVTNQGGNLSFGSKNTNCLPNGSGDAEQDGEPWTISTAYIRNGTLLSPLELGAIHRGAKWETINLKNATSAFSRVTEYDPAFDLNTAGTAYADGDGGILDQIKMTAKTFDSAKLNLNDRTAAATTAMRDLYTALFARIGINTTKLEASLTPGMTITDSDAETLAGKAHIKPGGLGYLFSRAEALYDNFVSSSEKFENFFGFDGTAPASRRDVHKESLIAKTVCLLTTKAPPPSFIQVVVVAQSVKDIGGNIAIAKYRPDGSGPINKTVATGTFDIDDAGTPDPRDDIYFDEITGEIKMLVTIERDGATKKMRIVRMEFLD